jgi:hypothetical protein
METTKEDFFIYEAEDIDLRVTLADPNDDLPTSIADATIVWVATGLVGGVPIITKGTGDDSIEIEDDELYIIRIHILEVDTRGLVSPKLYYKTSVTVDGFTRVLRFVGKNKGTFEIKENETDGVVVS